MSTGMIIFLVVLVVLIGICVGLYFFGKKAEKKQAEQQEQRFFRVHRSVVVQYAKIKVSGVRNFVFLLYLSK